MSNLQRHTQGGRFASHFNRGNGVRLRDSNKQSPMVDSQTVSDAEDEMEIDLFHEKLNSLKAKAKKENHGSVETDVAIVQLEQEIDQKLAHHYETSYQRHFEILDFERSKSSQEQRDEALSGICSRLAAKFAPELFKLHDLEILNKAIFSSQTDEETALAMRAYILEAALDIENSFDYIISTTLPALEKAMTDEGSSVRRASLITGFGVLEYFIHVDNGGFGLDEKIDVVLNIATESSTSNDSIVTCSALLAMALLMAATSSRNFAIKESIPDVVEMLKDDDIDTRKTAGKLIALMFELYDFSEQGDGTTNEQEFGGFAYTIPSLENNYVVSLLNDLINDTAKTVPKREKSEHRSIFRKVLCTVEARLSPLQPRQAEYSLLSSGEYASKVISHLHVSSSKALPVSSWHQLLLSSALKWVYANGLHTQIANNDLIYNAIVEASILNFGNDAEYVASGAATPLFGEAPDLATSSKLVDKNIARNRDLKTQAFMESDFPVKG